MLVDHPIFVLLGAAVIAPLLAELPVGRRVPVVVLEVLLGILVGPHVLGLIDFKEFNEFLSVMLRIGTAAVLFMAGVEIDFERIRGRPLSLALGGWAVSLALAFLAVVVLQLIPGVYAPLMVTLALATTGLGMLLPILRDGGQLETSLGRHLLAAGTVGEIGPIVGVSLALSDRSSAWQEFGFLLAFLALVALAVAVGVSARPPRIIALLVRALHTTTQLPVRLALLLLSAFVVVSMEFGFEAILGAFGAGMVVGMATRGKDGEAFRTRIDAVCFGWFTPFFFVGTGVTYDLGSLLRDEQTMFLIPTFLVLLLLVRGTPTFLYRNDFPRSERPPFGLFSSVPSLGLVVVIAQIGVATGSMNPAIAQALTGAALLSLLVYPTLARVLLQRAVRPSLRVE